MYLSGDGGFMGLFDIFKKNNPSEDPAGVEKNSHVNRITLKEAKEKLLNLYGHTKWDLSQPMLWGYFFTNNTRDLLENARDVLVSKGYRFVEIYLSDKEKPDEPDLWWLHIEKVEVHTPQTFMQRNNEFYKFAEDFKLEYDGWDCGLVKDKNLNQQQL